MNKKTILFLDDNEERHQAFARKHTDGEMIFAAYTVEEAINFLEKFSPFDEAHLDHDLGGQVFVASDEMSGYHVALHIARMDPEMRPKKIIVHSWNPAGATNMRSMFERYGIQSSYEPFTGR